MADVFSKLTVQAWIAKLRKHFKALKQAFSFGNESKTTTLTKSTLSGHVLSCLAMFNDIYGVVFARRKVGKKPKIKLLSLLTFRGPFAS